MKPGVYENISNAQYHGGPGISKSGLDLIARSPMHYKAVVDAANDNEPREPTPAQIIGTAFHCLLLEPEVFSREYCLGLRQSDVPDAIDGRDALVAMVNELNATRLPKLSTSGSKDELVARILDAEANEAVSRKTSGDLAAMKATELKEYIGHLNASRTGLLSTGGTIAELAQTLRDAGREFTLWSEVKAQWLTNNGHRIVLEQEAWDQLHRMRAAVMAHPAASNLMTMAGGVAERSVYWVDPKTGVLCRCRPDWWIIPRGIVVDVKTTDDASAEGFARSIADWRYHIQHPMYLDGINEMRRQVEAGNADAAFPADVPPEVKAFVFLAVEKKAPHAVAVYMLDTETRDDEGNIIPGQSSVDLGRALYRRDLDTYAACVANDNWPGYGDKIQPITVPAWNFTKNQALLDNAA
ncbi:PD-(D/E)XK nuclease-like domain-containing protein [Tardiphaga sp. 20_F10_N6_6]|uniref:PD-(D/E)XK nuclease-like domain-containing protein n=1 Tax=Tardiphaga sp. 20_F10_N6_6 TaxID=3240788 RepID=UPI003F88EA47